MRFINTLILMVAAIPFIASGNEPAVYAGSLGPISVTTTGVDRASKGETKRELRKRLSPLFSGDKSKLYRLEIEAQIENKNETAAYFGNIDTQYKSWSVILILSEMEPSKELVGTTKFTIISKTGALSRPEEAAKYFPEYVAERALIAINQIAGIDQQEELQQLAKTMRKTRGINPLTHVVDAGIATVVAGGKTAANMAGGAKDILLDADTVSSIHSATVAMAGNTSAEEILNEHQHAVRRFAHDARSRESDSVNRFQKQQQQQQVSQTLPENTSASLEPESEKVSESEECIAQAESTGPKPNVPQRYCHYIFADYTDNVSHSLGDYGNEFMKESHSIESAEETLEYELLQKAKKSCKAKGYGRVHNPESYAFNTLDARVTECKENNRMGSVFYLCAGSATYICARSD
ncbi:hypothetical protein [Microbulbifer aggregans]|uniref:hypothetical protein n=1 Tax=Microbulbifer aggregans TaxID=1769779 RepID=UPI001CFD16CF|nr:hypothetical protein [Microbulbifer aggregans]